MKSTCTRLILILTVSTLLAAGCSDDTADPDSGGSVDATVDTKVVVDKDNSGLPDGYKLWPCTKPGQTCNAHDPCAINPICGKDLKCRPTTLMDCRDNLDCTTDVCAGPGLCKNEPKAGTCALLVLVGGGGDGGADGGPDGGPDSGPGKSVTQCFKTGDKKPGDPCMQCNPQDHDGGITNNTKWMPVSGGKCDDKDLCTKDDTCKNGTCAGTYFGNLCTDNISCTDDLCDGIGGCKGNTIKVDWCLIASTCYKKGASHPSGGCSKCDPATSKTSWTPITNACLIGGKCYSKGDKHSGGCAECDPTTSTIAWTVKGTTDCLIDGTCVKAGVKNVTGCSSCDPTKDKYKWTPLTGICLIQGKCYTKGTKHPLGCAECDPAVSNSSWTVKGNYCFFSDKCYAAGVTDSSGCYSCQPSVNTSTFSPVKIHCKADNKCYAPKAAHPGGCATCTTVGSKTSWVVSGTTHCVISDKCYKSGAADPTNCATCDPTTNLYDWTPKPGYCSIQNKCYAKGVKHPEGCAACDPATARNAWTLTDTKRCLINYQCGDYCSGSCVYLQTNKNHCGKCGNACAPKFVCKAGVCKPDCEVVGSFESGTWPGSWIRKEGTSGSTSAAYAHDGVLGGYNMGWHQYGLTTFGKAGDKIFAWTRYTGTAGRTYLGFYSTSTGTWSAVFSTTTRSIIIQQNSSWGYADRAQAVGNFVANRWYKLQVEFLAGNQVKASVLDSNGTTVVASTTYKFPSAPVGGAAIRAFGSHQVDTISVCKN